MEKFILRYCIGWFPFPGIALQLEFDEPTRTPWWFRRTRQLRVLHGGLSGDETG